MSTYAERIQHYLDSVETLKYFVIANSPNWTVQDHLNFLDLGFELRCGPSGLFVQFYGLRKGPDVLDCIKELAAAGNVTAQRALTALVTWKLTDV